MTAAKIFLLLLLPGLCLGAADDAFKQSVINGYQQECLKVNADKGIDARAASRICSCEAALLQENFSVLQVIFLGIRAASSPDANSDKELQAFQEKLKACR